MHTSYNVAEGDFGGRFRQQIAAFFSALAFNYLLGLQFDEDLNQVFWGNSLIVAHLFDFARDTVIIMLGEPQDSSGRIVTFDGQLHGR